MIYNTLALANSVLSLFQFQYDNEHNEYVLEAFKGCGESGYTLSKAGTNLAASFAQSGGGDDIVVYCYKRFTLPKLLDDDDAMDEIAVYFNYDQQADVVRHLLDYFGDS